MSNGYLTSFDSTTLINHTTLCATSAAVITVTPHVLTYILPTGAKAAYNGTADAVVTPGTASQEIHTTSGGEAVYNALYAKVGNYSTTLVLSKFTGGTTNATAYLTSVEDITDRLHGPTGNTSMDIRVTFELLTNF